MATLMDRINNTAETVIDQNIIALNHPGGAVASDVLYASPASSKLDIVKLDIRNGVWKISPSSLGIGSSISFTIQNSYIISGCYLSGTITLPAYTNLCSNWFYYLINTVQIQVPGIPNFLYTGITLRDMYMMENPKARRDYLSSDLMPAVSTGSQSKSVDFIVPLNFFFNEGLLATKGFYLSALSFNSTIQVNIQFYPLYNVISGVTGQVPLTLPNSFDSLYMKTYAQIDHRMKEFEHRKDETFRLPFNFPQTYQLVNSTVANPSGHNSIQLAQLPQGELTRVCVSAYDATKVGKADNTQIVNYDPVLFKYIKLLFNGNSLIELESQKEVYNQQLYNSIADDAAIQYTSTIFGNTGGATGGQMDVTNNLCTLDCFIPAIAGSMYDSNFSLAKEYNGQTFTLEYQLVDSSIERLTWNITYLSNAVMLVKNGMGELIVS